MIEATIESIRVSLMTQNRVVILREKDGQRHLPIWIGAYEAEAIALELQGVTASRPLPYDLMLTMIDDLGGHLEQIMIAELNDQIFYASLTIATADRTLHLDARPSDALALAVRAKARILIDNAVMDNAGVTIADEKTPFAGAVRDERAGAGPNLTHSPDGPMSAQDADDLGVFRDFINTLDLDDFGKQRPSDRDPS